MNIEVTQADIDEGDACNCRECPVALAIARAVGVEVRVEYLRVFIKEKIIHLPEQAVDFIDDFDSERPVKPFSFDLAYP